MSEMWVASLIWVVSHLGISSSPVRRTLSAAIGEKAYLGLYSLIAFGALGYLIWVYTDVPRFDYLWLPNPDLYWFAKLILPVAFIFLVGGFMVKNPTMVGAQIEDADEVAAMATGVTRITRHPFQWAVVLWGVTHVIANGDWVSVIFFLSFITISLLGSFLIDVKKNDTLGPRWEDYKLITSNIPFAAIISGRNRLVLSELLWPAVVGLAVYAVFYYFHEFITGSVIV